MKYNMYPFILLGWKASKASGDITYREILTGCKGCLSPPSLNSASAAWHGELSLCHEVSADNPPFFPSVFRQWRKNWSMTKPFHKG